VGVKDDSTLRNLHSAKSSAMCLPSADSELPEIAGVGEHGEDCGDWAITGFCTHQHDNGEYCGCPNLQKHRCGGRTCPICWKSWRGKRKDKAVKRLIGYDLYRYKIEEIGASARAYFIDGEDSPTQKFRYYHSQVSIDDDTLTFSEARSEAAEKAREAGYDAFGMIPHHYRIPDEKKEELLEMYDINTRGGYWRALIENHRSDWRDFVEEGLHFHVIGSVGRKGSRKMKDGGEVSGGSDRVIVEHLRELETVGDVAASWSYVMSHATPPENTHYATWYGSISYQKFTPDDLTETTMSVFEEVLDHDGDDDGEDDGRECHACGSNEIEPIWQAQTFLNTLSASDTVRFRTPLDIAIEATLGENDPPTERDELMDYLWLTEKLDDTNQMNLAGEDATEDLRWQ